jgi:hypothetical protein
LPPAEVPKAPRYWHDKNEQRGLFWPRRANHSLVWLVEGALDAFAMLEAGASNVCASLTSAVTPTQAHELRGKYVLIYYDDDAPGYQGADKVHKALAEFGVHSTVIRRFGQGKDPGDQWIDNPDGLREFVRHNEDRYDPDETSYVIRLLSDPSPLLEIPSGLSSYDGIFGGGPRVGAHIVLAPPKAGKTQFVTHLYRTALEAEPALRGVWLTTELTKLQMWARIGSSFAEDSVPWVDAEKDPSLLMSVGEQMLQLADRTRIVRDVPVERLIQIAEEQGARLVVVDYLQRIPGVQADEEQRTQQRVARATATLSSWAMGYGAVVWVVSSVPNAAQQGGSHFNVKYSGDAEYVAQSVTELRYCEPLEDGTALRTLRVTANTRGRLGTAIVQCDLSRSRFWEDTV